MKKEDVLEIAMGAAPFLGKPDAEMVAVLESIVAEVERRTLERAAVVCDATAMCHGLALGSKEDKEMRGAKNCASSIRALREKS